MDKLDKRMYFSPTYWAGIDITSPIFQETTSFGQKIPTADEQKQAKLALKCTFEKVYRGLHDELPAESMIEALSNRISCTSVIMFKHEKLVHWDYNGSPPKKVWNNSRDTKSSLPNCDFSNYWAETVRISRSLRQPSKNNCDYIDGQYFAFDKKTCSMYKAQILWGVILDSNTTISDVVSFRNSRTSLIVPNSELVSGVPLTNMTITDWTSPLIETSVIPFDKNDFHFRGIRSIRTIDKITDIKAIIPKI